MFRKIRPPIRPTERVIFAAFCLMTPLVLSSPASAQWRQPTEFAPHNQPTADDLRKFEDVVEIQAIADVESVKPGKTFTMGVIFTIRRDWRIFWHSPSDHLPATLPIEPTKIEVQVPDGFTVSSVEYPAPSPWEQADGSRQFIYRNETALLIKITAPIDLGVVEDPDIEADAADLTEINIRIIASWSIQKDQRQKIYSYRRPLDLTLPVYLPDRDDDDDDDGAASTEQRVRLAEYQAKVPKPLGEAKDIKAYWDRDRLQDFFVLSFADADHVDFFPMVGRFATVPYFSQEVSGDPQSDGVLLRVYYGAQGGQLLRGGAIAMGVIVQQRGDRAEYYFVEMPRGGIRP